MKNTAFVQGRFLFSKVKMSVEDETKVAETDGKTEVLDVSDSDADISLQAAEEEQCEGTRF